MKKRNLKIKIIKKQALVNSNNELNNKNNNIPENKEIVGDNKKESKLIASISSYNNFNKAIGKYVYNKNLINNVNYKNSFMGIKNPNINDFQNFL